ncbi:MAG: hypothetical protein E6G37_08285 [Actinobacteria bacterium]|nr:MAG: hypothetical protein E6G63_07705 [Actinomycetota bacterium]TMK18833.1 MAG: hypothetical protein E6G65_11415 [Actinomycetota bacterium]TMK92531.1 MAG: hypothetical protein E6G37_08285 [Actinomycetota bacterium]TMM21286.1 MAG: hypothetical protein E6F95_11610 [Actinomycetota bacterium]
MSTWLVVWIVLGTVSTLALLGFVLALGRHVLILGRSARRFQAEVGPIAEEIAREGARASEHADRLGRTRPTGRS